MSEWRILALSELAAQNKNAMATGPFGSAISSRFFKTSGVPVIRGSNLSLDVGRRLVEDGIVFIDEAKAIEFERSVARRGDLIFTCWGTIGQVGLIDDRAKLDRYVVSNKQMKLSPNTELVLPLFLYYALSTPSAIAQVQGSSIGSSVPGFNLAQLRQIKVSIPDIATQHAVAELLGSLDDKIAVNERIAGTAHELGSETFRQHLLGQEMRRLSDVMTPILGGTPDRDVKRYWVGDVPWASAKDVANARFGVLLRTQEHVSRQATFETRAQTVPIGSTIITARGTVGAVARTTREVAFNQSCYAFYPSELFPASILYFTIKLAASQLEGKTHGTVFDTITMRTFDHIDVPVLSEKNIGAVEARIRPLLEIVDHHLSMNHVLTTLRNELLPKLISGALRVKDAERLVSEAV